MAIKELKYRNSFGSFIFIALKFRHVYNWFLNYLFSDSDFILRIYFAYSILLYFKKICPDKILKFYIISRNTFNCLTNFCYNILRYPYDENRQPLSIDTKDVTGVLLFVWRDANATQSRANYLFISAYLFLNVK